MKHEDLERFEKCARYMLEVLLQDQPLLTVFHEAAQGRRSITLVVKGSRPMYRRGYTYGFNYFWIKGYRKNNGTVPVPTICRLARIDPCFVQDAYSYFRNHERWPRPKPELDDEIDLARKQVITNLFPFPEIEWCRESGSTGEIYPLYIIQRTPPFLSEEEIRKLFEPGKATWKAWNRHLKREMRERERRQVRYQQVEREFGLSNFDEWLAQEKQWMSRQ